VGLGFQNGDVQPFCPSVFDELAFGPLQIRWPAQEIRERVAEVLRAMDIAHLQDGAPHRLSGGEKKRVALASVLVLDPEVLLLDLDTLEDIADRCYVFANGRVAGVGTPLEILHDVELLERAKLIHPHAHVHGEGVVQPHPHVHRHEGG
jgi:cobalt/nickel transport system ATP-binding protein